MILIDCKITNIFPCTCRVTYPSLNPLLGPSTNISYTICCDTHHYYNGRSCFDPHNLQNGNLLTKIPTRSGNHRLMQDQVKKKERKEKKSCNLQEK